MYVCMHVCIYVCLSEWIGVLLLVSIYGNFVIVVIYLIHDKKVVYKKFISTKSQKEDCFLKTCSHDLLLLILLLIVTLNAVLMQSNSKSFT